MRNVAAIAAAVLLGCASPAPTSSTTGSTTSPPPASKPDPSPPSTTPPPPAGTDPGTAPKPAGPGIGEKCGANDACAPPATCVTYYGIAGPRGPAFKSCEVKCTTGQAAACPDNRKCTTIADGPGSVCR